MGMTIRFQHLEGNGQNGGYHPFRCSPSRAPTNMKWTNEVRMEARAAKGLKFGDDTKTLFLSA